MISHFAQIVLFLCAVCVSGFGRDLVTDGIALSNGQFLLLITSVSDKKIYVVKVNPDGSLDKEFGPEKNGRVEVANAFGIFDTNLRMAATTDQISIAMLRSG